MAEGSASPEQFTQSKAEGQTPLQELHALPSEVHALAASLLPEQKTSETPAKREYIHDEKGNITDIVFDQNGNRASLKDVLPIGIDRAGNPIRGSYVIKLKRSEEGRGGSKANCPENYLTLFEPEQPDTIGQTNLDLLHEAGHMVDYAHNQSLYTSMERQLTLSVAKIALASERHYALTQGLGAIPEENMKSIRADLEEMKTRFTPEEYQSIEQEFEQAIAQIGTMTSVEDLSAIMTEQRRIHVETETKYSFLSERNAWAQALTATRQLSRQGINIFTGTREKLLQLIDDSLYMYELIYKVNGRLMENPITPPKFVKKRTSKF